MAMPDRAIIGQYWPEDSLVHAMDPRVKFILSFVLMAAVFCALGAPAPEAFAAFLREVGFTLGRDLYDERTLAADIAAQLEGAPAAAMLGAAPGFAARQAADAVAEGGDGDA